MNSMLLGEDVSIEDPPNSPTPNYYLGESVLSIATRYIRQPIPQIVTVQPYDFVPLPDQSVDYRVREDNLIRVDYLNPYQAFQDYPHQDGYINHQIFLRTDDISPIQEWDIAALIRRNLVLQVMVVALRDHVLLYNAHNFIIQCGLATDLVRVVEFLCNQRVEGLELFLHKGKLPIPDGYSTDPLQYGINFARLSIHWINQYSNDLRWCVTPQFNDPTLRTGFPIPGLMLGQGYQPLWMYTWDSFAENYNTTTRPPTVVTSNAPMSQTYRRRQAQFLCLRISTFPNLSAYTSNPNTLQMAETIRCPQLARLYARHNWLNLTGRQEQRRVRPNTQARTEAVQNLERRRRNRNRRQNNVSE